MDGLHKLYSLTKSKLYTSVVFDLGDVLFTWSPSTTSLLPAKMLRDILRSFHWFEYEKGNLTEGQAYSLVAQEFNVTAASIEDAFQSARDSLQSQPDLLNVIRELKESGLQVYAMSNISAPDWAVLSTKVPPEEWALFDHIFTSSAARERKPNIGFYQHVINETGMDPSRTIFVDDKIENVLTARSFGMYGIVFNDMSNVIQQLKNLVGDPISRGRRFLAMHKKQLISVTSNNIELSENFAQLLILEATGDESLVEYVGHVGQFNFFRDGATPTTEFLPNDLDTTAIGLTVSNHIDNATKHAVMDEMLKFRNSDGIIQVYFDNSRPRIGDICLFKGHDWSIDIPKDPVVCVNVLTLFYENGRGHELSRTLDWVEQVLLNRAYISGTYYYISADLFLFFLSRLFQAAPEVRRRLESTFKERIAERFGAESDALSLAARIVAAAVVKLADRRDLDTLLSMQREDGSWDNGWFYRYGSSGILIRNDGVTTALAIRAIKEVQTVQSKSATKTFRPLSNLLDRLISLSSYFILTPSNLIL